MKPMKNSKTVITREVNGNAQASAQSLTKLACSTKSVKEKIVEPENRKITSASKQSTWRLSVCAQNSYLIGWIRSEYFWCWFFIFAFKHCQQAAWWAGSERVILYKVPATLLFEPNVKSFCLYICLAVIKAAANSLLALLMALLFLLI